jgi:hypothetical protein
MTLDAVADGIDEAAAVEGIGWDVPRGRTVRRLAPIEPALTAAASDILKRWGREAN